MQNDLDLLDQRIQDKLAGVAKQRHVYMEHTSQRMTEWDERTRRFNTLANRAMQTIIRPRIERLASYFDHARLLKPDECHQHHCVCSFPRTDRYPATTRLDMAIGHDDRIENMLMLYHLEILPVFFQFKGPDQIAFPLDNVDEERMAAWIEERIVEFLESYLKLEFADKYQHENMVTDPVCGMRINKTTAAAEMECHGQIYYFCVKGCHRKFAENPQQYTRIKLT